jgi:hypothetical protein
VNFSRGFSAPAARNEARRAKLLHKPVTIGTLTLIELYSPIIQIKLDSLTVQPATVKPSKSDVAGVQND